MQQSADNVAEGLPAPLRLYISVLEVVAEMREHVQSGIERVDSEVVGWERDVGTDIDVAPAVEGNYEAEEPGEDDKFEPLRRGEYAVDLCDYDADGVERFLLDVALLDVPGVPCGRVSLVVYAAGGEGERDVDEGRDLGGREGGRVGGVQGEAADEGEQVLWVRRRGREHSSRRARLGRVQPCGGGNGTRTRQLR